MPLVLPGQEASLNEPGRTFARHHHLAPYAALLVRGDCDEAGDRGRFEAVAGDVLVHQAFDAHGNRVGGSGATFINIALDRPLDARFGRVRDLDRVVRAFECDADEGRGAFLEEFEPREPDQRDWPDLLASALGRRDRFRLDHWAEFHGLHPASISRGFRLAFGVSPKRFRLERLASRAARRIRESCEPLSAVASDCGFADQAHMTRAFRLLFGVTPRMLRALRYVRSRPRG